MPLRSPHFLPWIFIALALGMGGAAWIANDDLARQREAFETDARIAHRLLSQQAVQHDAILATLALLQPGASASAVAGADAPERRLPSVYPQVLSVLKRERDAAWPDARLQAAEARSRGAQRAEFAEITQAASRYTIVRAADPASFALEIDIQRAVPWAEWPLPRNGPVKTELQIEGQAIVLQPGAAAAGRVRTFTFSKRLAADSQPFDLVLTRQVGIGALPWALMAAWCAAVLAVVASLAAWRRQHAARRRAEELLRLGQVGRLNALGELAAGMAHELNQPLTALLASTQAAGRMLADDPPDLDTARVAMDRAAQQAKRAADVVARLRRLVQRPEDSATPTTLSLARAVHNVMHLLEPECVRRGVRVSLPSSAEHASVTADPVAVEQILHNLVLNGLQALEHVAGDERELSIEIVPGDGPTAALIVRDSGPGVAPEALPRLFEPFFTTRAGGLGLGLSLCETLAIGMGATLTCGNRAPRGAEFRLTLPRALA